MNISRLIFLQVFVILLVGTILVLPTQPERPDPGISMELPDFIGEWYGEDIEVSEREIEVLGKETQFARKLYTNAKGDHIFVSIVLAGHDMNTSIHRPERCLPAQGYTMLDSSRSSIPIGATGSAKGGKESDALTITRLHNQRNIPISEQKDITEKSLNYYWFVSSTETTPDHVERNLMDIRDRIFKGYNQPWAFVTVLSRISEGLTPYGLSEEQTDEMLSKFISELAPKVLSEKVNVR